MPNVVKSSAREMILKVKNIEEIHNVIKLTEDAFESIMAEDWTAQCTHVKHLEEEYL
ncbi:uncharacterized protein LOC123708383 [Pieris brassicae]|uniref:uncharacterized protein LOC123708383 n=1 Tax=Pieris brassicae TaxID=7116 RepID=UPI001E660EFB|nr:uncharacterized protein LOC123708383 [Pieris brassicae]